MASALTACVCGHSRIHHVYEEGPCRGPEPCTCREFEEAPRVAYHPNSRCELVPSDEIQEPVLYIDGPVKGRMVMMKMTAKTSTICVPVMPTGPYSAHAGFSQVEYHRTYPGSIEWTCEQRS